jgi:hypothetical protein
VISSPQHSQGGSGLHYGLHDLPALQV